MLGEVKEIEVLHKSCKEYNNQIYKLNAKISKLKTSIVEKIVSDIKTSNEYKNYVKACKALSQREKKSVFKKFTIVFQLNKSDYPSDDPMDSEYTIEIDSLHLNDKPVSGSDFNAFDRDINQDYFCTDALRLIPNLYKKAEKLKNLPELNYDDVDKSIESLLAFKEFEAALNVKLKLVVEVEWSEDGGNTDLKILSFDGTKIGKKLISQNINAESFAHFFENDESITLSSKLVQAKREARSALSVKIDKSTEPYTSYISRHGVDHQIMSDAENEKQR